MYETDDSNNGHIRECFSSLPSLNINQSKINTVEDYAENANMFMCGLGWLPDIVDDSDDEYVLSSPYADDDDEINLPECVDLRPQMPPLYDQGMSNTCTAQSTCAQIWYSHEDREEGGPSRLFQYYNTRFSNNTHALDKGSTLKSSLKAAKTLGHCPEKYWELDITKSHTRPPIEIYNRAYESTQVDFTYKKILNIVENELEYILSNKIPINFGALIYQSFKKEGGSYPYITPLPKVSFEKFYGGHSMLIVGYDSSKRLFIVRNSWGESWADNGYHYMPYDYILDKNLCNDFWIIESIKHHRHDNVSKISPTKNARPFTLKRRKSKNILIRRASL